VFHINLPPLRDHKDDISLLVDYILRDINANTETRARDRGGSSGYFHGHTWPETFANCATYWSARRLMCEKDLITRACLPGELEKRERRHRAIFFFGNQVSRRNNG